MSLSESVFSAPHSILKVWKLFDVFPMETLTKAWVLKYQPQSGQRSVDEMVSHREKTGASGNCFDLAIWLIHEFKKAKILSYAVGDLLGTPKAHVGVIAVASDGKRFLCDLGDLWIQPINIDGPNVEDSEQVQSGHHHCLHSGFFTAAKIKIVREQNSLKVEYHRSNAKISLQSYNLTPVSTQSLKEAANISQRTLSRPLVEMRLFEQSETVHWEFNDFSSSYSRASGLYREPDCATDYEWATRIAARTGMQANYVKDCLAALKNQL